MAKKKNIDDNQEVLNESSSDHDVPSEIDVNSTKSRRSNVRNRAGEKDGRDTIALILSIIFVAALGFFGYQYFNDADINLSERFSNVINLGNNDTDGDTSSDRTTRDSEDRDDDTRNGTGGNVAGDSDDGFVRNAYAEGQMWIANDYQKGDIDTGNYTVVYGDTLWELAEGAYGDGTQWTRILEANSGSVGYLPNGQQALIITGQTLVIPNL